MSNIIKLTESDLHNIIKESVNQIIRENNDEIKPYKHIPCKLTVIEAKGKVIPGIAFEYLRCGCIELWGCVLGSLCLIYAF